MASDEVDILGAAVRQMTRSLEEHYPQFQDIDIAVLAVTKADSFHMITNVPTEVLVNMLTAAIEKASNTKGIPLDRPQG